MILAMTLAALATVFAKALTDDMHVLQILWLRLVFGCILIWPLYLRVTGRSLPRVSAAHALRHIV